MRGRIRLGIAAAAVLLAGGAAAQDGDAISAVIADQLQDFNDRDLGGAWDHASVGIQQFFRTPENFGAMVSNGYPMVWTNGGAEFLDLRVEEDGRLWQRVRLRDGDGRIHMIDYAMIEAEDGWKIDGVVLLPMPDVGV